jgi:hypothetical protein
MLQALAQRWTRWFRRAVPLPGDVAGEAWADVGTLPPARPLGMEEPAAIPLVCAMAPPIPLDARPAKAGDAEWEALLSAMLAPPPPMPPPAEAVTAPLPMPPPAEAVTAPLLVAPPSSDEREWEELIAAARARAAAAPPVQAVPAPARDELEWEAAIARAKAFAPLAAVRPAPRPTPAPRAAAPAHDPVREAEERSWVRLIARSKAGHARPAPKRAPESGSWTAAIAAAKLRHHLQAAS